jgi:2-polyprenyl-3-methyl-5-hydroxy-6-metoxy-1,4-benzoquinol methylase
MSASLTVRSSSLRFSGLSRQPVLTSLEYRLFMLHKGKVAQVVLRNARRRVRGMVGLRPRTTSPWSESQFEEALRRHTELVRLFLDHWPPGWDLAGKTVCEVGCGDCLSLAGLLIGLGAGRVELVEPAEPVLDPRQIKILENIRHSGYKVDASILLADGVVRLDTSRVTYHRTFMDSLNSAGCYDYVFSMSVLEHVEDLPGFYGACSRALKPQGRMFHLIDFSGHGELEEPVPPLDFQTYPDWLYDLMYPPFHRATRFFLSQHQQAVQSAGFVLDETRINRRAEPEYLQAVWPQLRRKARLLAPQEAGVLEAVIISHKP